MLLLGAAGQNPLFESSVSGGGRGALVCGHSAPFSVFLVTLSSPLTSVPYLALLFS